MVPDLTEYQTSVLTAVVEGFKAREGLKDRMRALNEWEIARRTGQDLSYAEFLEHPARETLMQALSALQQRGLVGVWERGAKYDSFVPTTAGTQAVEPSAPPVVPESVREAPAVAADPIVDRLDEIIRLLKSIDSKFGGR
jgi:hypothetical protein